jgi:hypothetical protein
MAVRREGAEVFPRIGRLGRWRDRAVGVRGRLLTEALDLAAVPLVRPTPSLRSANTVASCTLQRRQVERISILQCHACLAAAFLLSDINR